MKKVSELIKPYLAIIFGALLFLVYLNYLQLRDGALALGIIAVTFAAFYLAAGILGIVLGEKLPKGLKLTFEIGTIVLFPILMFTYFLIMTINVYDNMGPTSWVIVILSMLASLGLAGLYIISKFIRVKVIARFTYLFAAIFVLALLLDILFDLSTGYQNIFGNIALSTFALYILFSYMLMNSFVNAGEAKEEAKEEAAAEEEAEVEETKEEEAAAEEEAKAEQ